MKIKTMEDCLPIHLDPGDTLVLEYDGQTILKSTIDIPMVVDRLGIVDLEQAEVDQLGLQAGVAGVFGERKL